MLVRVHLEQPWYHGLVRRVDQRTRPACAVRFNSPDPMAINQNINVWAVCIGLSVEQPSGMNHQLARGLTGGPG